MTAVADRVARLDWAELGAALDQRGFATVPRLLDPAECDAVAGLFGEGRHFRSRVDMARHGYGRGEYGYFAYPLPPLVAELRGGLYRPLAAVANRWRAALGSDERFPADHERFLERCRAADQTRPTPLLLRYGAGGYNRLHQDLYGEHVFPLQVAILLSAPGEDFAGGRFVLTQTRARMQSRADVVDLAKGDAVVFAVRDHPVAGARGPARAALRHGVSEVERGARQTLGIIFHDAA